MTNGEIINFVLFSVDLINWYVAWLILHVKTLIFIFASKLVYNYKQNWG